MGHDEGGEARLTCVATARAQLRHGRATDRLGGAARRAVARGRARLAKGA